MTMTQVDLFAPAPIVPAIHTPAVALVARASATLRDAEWDALVLAVKAGEFDDL